MENNKEIVLHELKKDIVTMVTLAIEANIKSIKAFLDHNTLLANEIIEEDQKVNELETLIESKGLKCLALYQPEASDLRFVVGVLRMVTDVERIGDLAVNIAESVKKTELELKAPMDEDAISDISYMSKIAIAMVQDSINSVILEDIELAKSVLKQDEQVDQINRQIFRELLVSMMEDPKKISSLIQYLLVSKNLERMADHGTNIAESAIFILKGKNIKHHGIDEVLV